MLEVLSFELVCGLVSVGSVAAGLLVPKKLSAWRQRRYVARDKHNEKLIFNHLTAWSTSEDSAGLKFRSLAKVLHPRMLTRPNQNADDALEAAITRMRERGDIIATKGVMEDGLRWVCYRPNLESAVRYVH